MRRHIALAPLYGGCQTGETINGDAGAEGMRPDARLRYQYRFPCGHSYRMECHGEPVCLIDFVGSTKRFSREDRFVEGPDERSSATVRITAIKRGETKRKNPSNPTERRARLQGARSSCRRARRRRGRRGAPCRSSAACRRRRRSSFPRSGARGRSEGAEGRHHQHRDVERPGDEDRLPRDVPGDRGRVEAEAVFGELPVGDVRARAR